MRYRASCEYEPDWVSDIFNGHIYHDLCHTKIEVDGQRLPCNYFSDPHDIALGLSTDGFAPFQCRKTTTWPIIVYNFNLPPDIHFHCQYILCLGVVPGPKKPKDFDSSLWPAVEEFLRLALGTRAYDALECKLFLLQAHLILIGGDILSPCSCLGRGSQPVEGDNRPCLTGQWRKGLWSGIPMSDGWAIFF